MRAREVNRRAPLTEKQVARLKIGNRVRSIPNYVYHVVGILPGKDGDLLYVLAVWSYRWRWWRYEVHNDWSMAIGFTTYSGTKTRGSP